MEIVNTFNGLEITERKIAVSVIKHYYEKNNKNIIQRKPYSILKINFKCQFKDCIFSLCCKKSKNIVSSVKSYVIDIINSNLSHGVKDNNGNIIGLCTGINIPSTVRILIIINK